MKTNLSYVLYCVVLCQTAFGQNSVQFLGAGFGLPGHLAAPGEIVTFFITGAKTILPELAPIRRANVMPLPTSLAGFSVSITQGPTHPSQQVLPIFSVEQKTVCSDSTTQPSCIITAITVQIPVNLTGFLGDLRAIGDNHALSITENGSPSASFNIVLLTDLVHILTTCDSVVPNQGSGPCTPKITHADGIKVSPSAPAAAGETLVMYAAGLGSTRPAVPAGSVTPSPAPVTLGQFRMQYSYAIDSAVSVSPPFSQGVPANIDFSGLTPGEIGVYQVNFTVPAPPPNAASCDPLTNPNPDGTNLVVTVWGGQTRDSARICVKLP